MKTAKNEMPTSKAKTAYGLLSEVRALILEEPKRYKQGTWLEEGDNESFPPCGTRACVAGWVTKLKGVDGGLLGIGVEAQKILGLDDDQEYELFNEGAAKGQSQTRAHATSGAAHIRRFQKKYAAQLKARRV